jgi:hypothetical protein
MIAVSLEFVVGYALLASAVVMWLNHRRTSAVRSGAVLLALCLLIAGAHLFPRGHAMPTRQAIQLWLVFVLLPSATVWGVSRAEFLMIRPWLLLILGPITFIVALVVFGTAANVLFATRHLQ